MPPAQIPPYPMNPQMLHSSGTSVSTYIMWGLIALVFIIIIASIIMYIHLTNKISEKMKKEYQLYQDIMTKTFTKTTPTPTKK